MTGLLVAFMLSTGGVGLPVDSPRDAGSYSGARGHLPAPKVNAVVVQTLRVSHADLSSESVATLREISRISNLRSVMGGGLIFGTVVNLMTTRGMGVAAALNARDLDTSVRALDALGVIVACRIQQVVSLRILDANGFSASAPWKTRAEERYFDELLRQSEAVCSR